MKCSICIFLREDPDDAITVMNGQAVCEEHQGYVQGGEHDQALGLAHLNEKYVKD